VNSRNITVFFNLSIFNETVDGLGKSVSIPLTAHIHRFEMAWRNSRHDGDIPSGYHTEQDKEEVSGSYHLYQIRVGPKHGYRAWVMILDSRPEAYWVHAYKKGKDRQPEDMERARILAQRHWEKIRRGNNAAR
jgi:hypothetical protein